MRISRINELRAERWLRFVKMGGTEFHESPSVYADLYKNPQSRDAWRDWVRLVKIQRGIPTADDADFAQELETLNLELGTAPKAMASFRNFGKL